MKHTADYQPTQNSMEKTPNYTLRRGIAAVALLGTTAGLGVAFAKHDTPKSPDAHPTYTTAVETLELGQGDTVIDTAINGARNINPDLSLEDQTVITHLAQEVDRAPGVVQPGYEVTVRYGEYDGKPDTNGEFGTDYDIEVTPDVIK